MSPSSNYSDRIETDGYAVVEDALTPSTVETLREAITTIPTRDEVRRRQQTYGVRNLLEICPAVRAVAGCQTIRQWVIPVLGRACFAARAIFFDKVMGANWGLGWHQDSVISVREKRDAPGFSAWSQKANVWQVQPPAEVLAEILAVRIHLDDCDKQNGPLRVIPGSHRFGWLDNEIDRWKQRVPEVTCTARAGGLVMMRPLLLHASAPAVSPQHRRVIHIEFAHHDLPAGLQWNQRIGARPSSLHQAS